MTSQTAGPAHGSRESRDRDFAMFLFMVCFPLCLALFIGIAFAIAIDSAKPLEVKQPEKGPKTKRREVSPPRGPNHIAKLPPEVLLMIFELLQNDTDRSWTSSLPKCARICRSWQPLVESITFRVLRVRTGTLTAMDPRRDILIWKVLMERCHLIRNLVIDTHLCHYPAAHEGERQRAPQPLAMQKLASRALRPARIGAREHGAAEMTRFKIQHKYLGAKMLGSDLVDACEGCDTMKTTWELMEKVNRLSKGGCGIDWKLHVKSRQLPNVRHTTTESYRTRYPSVCPWCDSRNLDQLLKLPIIPAVYCFEVWYDTKSLYFDSGPAFHLTSRMPYLRHFDLHAYTLGSVERLMPFGGSEVLGFGKHIDLLPDTVESIGLSYPVVPYALSRALGAFVHNVALRPGLRKLMWSGVTHNSIFGGLDVDDVVKKLPKSATLEDFTITTIDDVMMFQRAEDFVIVPPPLVSITIFRPEELLQSVLKMANMAYRLPNLKHFLLTVESQSPYRVQYIPGYVEVSEEANRFPLTREIKMRFRDATRKHKGPEAKMWVAYPRKNHPSERIKQLQREASRSPQAERRLLRTFPELHHLSEFESNNTLMDAYQDLVTRVHGQ